jgi:Bacterial Ig domain
MLANAWRPRLFGTCLFVIAALSTIARGEAGVLDASWTAPTTNTDGTPLTDLSAYRVYYGTSSSPCPGPTFFQVASPTANPGAEQTVAFRLTGLTSGALYRVSITAVDASGNESACSPTASAVAQAGISVNPTASVSFGNVSVGSFGTQTFTLSNTRGGTVSGTVSASAPFSVTSGTPFTLSGQGATQNVTVRFTPTQPALSSSNVTFSAVGDALSRLVTGTGVALDTTAPTITITSPTSNSTFSTGNATVALGGTASDASGVAQVTWTNNRGGSGTASGTTAWTAPGISLLPGQTVFTVRAHDTAGNTGTDSLTVTLTVTFTFTDDPVAAHSTEIKAAHFTELRTAVNSLRAALGLAPTVWTDPTLVPGNTRVRAIHLTELRNALSQAYQAAGRMLPTFTDSLGPTIIRAIHLNELRAAIRGF